ncbi:hypothetical protein AMTRI_Chr03g52160 [Amborella trichopoda]
MHPKKSEVQIGTESRGVSSDYKRAPLLHHHNHNPNNHPWLHHQKPPIELQNEQIHLNKRAMASVPTSPSLSRSPTLTTLPTFSHYNKHHHHRLLRHLFTKSRRNHHLLLPPFLILAIPTFYLFFKSPSSSSSLSLGLWFDFFSALLFVSALIVSLRIAFPHLLPSPLSRTLAAFSPLLRLHNSKLFLSLLHHHPKLPLYTRSAVSWTIGSKPQSLRSSIPQNLKEGVRVYSNGDVYEGEFHKGKCSGSGVYYYYMSGRYEGEWVDEKYDGYGVETWARGSRYRGQYRQGLRHGYGVYRFYTGDVYAGEWSNGQSHGCGAHTCEDGSRYVGEFKWGVKHGLGHYHFRNGDKYAGEYFADKMHGFGVYRFANGHRYEGAWHEGRKQGLGMYTFRNGETQSGHWQNGSLDTLSTQNTLPGSPIAINHSKVLNAVQEARWAAERALEVPPVDERVNKAVAAANRAANAARVAAVKAVQKRTNNNDKSGISHGNSQAQAMV